MSDRLHTTAIRAGHIPTLYTIYRACTERLPHNLMPSLDQFQGALLGDKQDSILVAEEHGVARGFAALSRVKDDDGTEADAIVALFAADALASAPLVAACITRTGADRLLAFPRTHGQCPVPGYNGGWDGMSAQLPEIAHVLTEHGFVPYYHEWLMSCDLKGLAAKPSPSGAPPADDVVSPIAEFTIRAEISDKGELIQHAWAADTQIGMCYYAALAAPEDRTRAAQIGYIEWLWVDPNHRRRGIARELLIRALHHLRSLGCQVCWLTTGAENWSAQPLYHAFGFQMVDIATSFQRL